MKYLVRQTYTERNINDSENWMQLKKLNFWEFLYEAGMFSSGVKLQDCTEGDKQAAKSR